MRFSSTAVYVVAVLGFMSSSSLAFVNPKGSQSRRMVGPNSVKSITPGVTPANQKTTTSLSALPGSAVLSSTFQVASTAIESITSSQSFTYLVEKVIDASIPAIFSIIVIFFFFGQFRDVTKGDDDDDEDETTNSIAELYNDLYGTTKGGGVMRGRGRRSPFGGGGPFDKPALPKNLGLPQKEYIKITNLNEKYDAYDFSMIKSTQSKARAAADFRLKSFERALGVALNSDNDPLPNNGVRTKLISAEKNFLKQGKELASKIQKLESKLAQMTIDEALLKIGKGENITAHMIGDDPKMEGVVDAEIVVEEDKKDAAETATALMAEEKTEENNGKSFSSSGDGYSIKQKLLLKKIANLQGDLKQLELDFIKTVLASVGGRRAVGLRNALLGDISVRGTGGLLMQMQERPLSALLRSDVSPDDESSRKKALYVMQFPGDVQASQLNELREEVTAVVRNAKPGDEALVVLQSGGGTVTGYGLAAGQLVRLKEKGLRLTIAVGKC
jgi:hypothetical protein